MNALIKLTPKGYRLEIGGHAVGVFFSLSEAIASAFWRGVPESRIAFDIDPLPGAEKFNS